MPRKETVADSYFEVEQGFLLMPKVSFPCVEGVCIEYSIEGSHASSLDGKKR